MEGGVYLHRIKVFPLLKGKVLIKVYSELNKYVFIFILDASRAPPLQWKGADT